MENFFTFRKLAESKIAKIFFFWSNISDFIVNFKHIQDNMKQTNQVVLFIVLDMF